MLIGSVPAGGKPKTVTSLRVSLHLSLAVWLGRMGGLYRSISLSLRFALHSQFQATWSYIVRLCLKKQSSNNSKKERTKEVGKMARWGKKDT